MRTHEARIADVEVGDCVQYTEETLWGARVISVPVFRKKHDGSTVELELRRDQRLVALLRFSNDVLIRIADRPNNVIPLRKAA